MIFDAVVAAIVLLAVVTGFNSGLLRSLATILGYLIAAPVALAAVPTVAGLAFGAKGTAGGQALTLEQTWLLFFGVFVVTGLLISALLRAAISEFAGPEIGLFDRMAGATLGAARIFLVAVLVVVIFDRVMPAGDQPRFLAGSRLRPYLSAAGQRGLKSLPPEIDGYIDELKRQHGL